MANDNKNIKELVDADEDPTEELETLALVHDGSLEDDTASQPILREHLARPGRPALVSDEPSPLATETSEAEDDAPLAGSALAADLDRLARKLADRERELAANRELLVEKDRRIAAVEADLRSLEGTLSGLRNPAQAIHVPADATRPAEELAGRLAASEAEVRRLTVQLEKTETYADDLRHKLADLASNARSNSSEQGSLTAELEALSSRLADSDAELEAARAIEAEVRAKLEDSRAAHEQEIRTLRFELGEAESTSSEYETINDQLVSELVTATNAKKELERMLTAHEEQSQARIDEYQARVTALESKIASYRERLEIKHDAIRSLLEELTKNEEENEQDMKSTPRTSEKNKKMETSQDNLMTRSGARADDGVARLLVSRFGDREVRFPLFKDRLTIGRTDDNDIQLKAQFISRRHAVICSGAEVTRIIDWDSKNGLYVNSKRVTEHFLKDGDIVMVGDAEFRYEERIKQDR